MRNKKRTSSPSGLCVLKRRDTRNAKADGFDRRVRRIPTYT